MTSNIHTVHHGKSSVTGRSKEIEGYIEKELDWVRESLEQFDLPLASMLDIGCDYGHALKYAQDSGLVSGRLVGVDPFYEERSTYPELAYHRFSGADVNLPELIGPAFDLVLLNHSLEHFHTPYDVLRNVKQLTRKFAAIALPLAGTSWAYWPGHVSLWDPRFLIRVMGDIGFHLVGKQKLVCFREDYTEFWSVFSTHPLPGEE